MGQKILQVTEMKKVLNRLTCLASLSLLAACEPIDVEETTPPSPPELSLSEYYKATEAELIANGKLRTETSPQDAPFSYEDLIRNFEQIALYDEYSVSNGRFIASQTASRLRRWEGPIRVGIIHGQSVPASQRLRDNKTINEYIKRLSKLTNRSMQISTQQDSDLLVLVLNSDEQIEFASTLPQRFPGIDTAAVDAFTNSPRNVVCSALAFHSEKQRNVYDRAIILIKAEHSALMRKSCIHEEIAQAMGLTNDSPDARPSIFNDDEEFAFLTKHDEILLKMLYDPRLSAGMGIAEIRSKLPEIASDVVQTGI